MPAYQSIPIAGGDTATPLNLAKRLALIERSIPPQQMGARILDAGCGAGEYVAALTSRGYDAVGVEYSSEKVDAWQRLHPGDERVQVGNLARLKFAQGSIDVVVLNEVLEHVPDELAALNELRRVLKPDGRLIIFAPNRLYPFETHGVDRLKTGDRIPPVRTFAMPWLPRSVVNRLVRPWARNYSPWELREKLRQAQFEIRATDYLWQTFENISGRQPRILRSLRPIARGVSSFMERIPVIRAFGVSQMVVASPANPAEGI